MMPVFTQTYQAPPVDTREILRYAGVRGEVAELQALLQSCLDEVQAKLCYRVCYAEFALLLDGQTVDLEFVKTQSLSLQRHLFGCERAVVFAATVGIELDRLIAKYGKTQPSRALMLQAVGAERVEALCDSFCQDLACRMEKEGWTTCPRFSPGYGDLPLQLQRDVLGVLQASTRIGLTLGNHLLMSPTKSVTAIVGLRRGRA